MHRPPHQHLYAWAAEVERIKLGLAQLSWETEDIAPYGQVDRTHQVIVRLDQATEMLLSIGDFYRAQDGTEVPRD